METLTNEIADSIYRFSTYASDIAAPAGFTFNQFLVMADEPLLFHCGARGLFGSVSDAVAAILPLEELRWISFGHVEADECGSMNQWLAAAPNAQIVHGETACMVSLNDLADRAPRSLADKEALDLGNRKIVWRDTPHVPHGWEAGVIFEEVTRTLLCGDLFTHVGAVPALVETDIVGPAIAAEEMFRASSMNPESGATIRALAQYEPDTLALMHGSSFRGDCGGALRELADYFDEAVRRAVAPA